jgi:hypothetical protein
VATVVAVAPAILKLPGSRSPALPEYYGVLCHMNVPRSRSLDEGRLDSETMRRKIPFRWIRSFCLGLLSLRRLPLR